MQNTKDIGTVEVIWTMVTTTGEVKVVYSTGKGTGDTKTYTYQREYS